MFYLKYFIYHTNLFLAHPFFASVDWKKIIRKEIEPPFKPHLSGNLDVTYFDPNCTEAPVGSGEDIRAGTTPDVEDVCAIREWSRGENLTLFNRHLHNFHL